MGKPIDWSDVMARNLDKGTTFLEGHVDFVEGEVLFRGEISSMGQEDGFIILGLSWRGWCMPADPQLCWIEDTGTQSIAISTQYQPKDIGNWRIHIPTLQGEATLFPKGNLKFEKPNVGGIFQMSAQQAEVT